MTKYYTFLILLCFPFCILNAQNNTDIGLQLPVIKKTASPSGIASIEVMNGLADSTFIGVLPSAFPNVRTNVLIQQGVPSWLQDYIAMQFNGSFTAEGEKLLWIINGLRVGRDSSAGGVTSFVKLSANIFDNSADVYQLKNMFDTTIVSTDPNFDLGKNLAIAIGELFNSCSSQDLNEKQKSNPVKGPVLTRSALLQSLDSAGDHKVLLDSIHPRGVFLSFQEFLNNAPSISSFSLAVDEHSKGIQFYEISTDSSARMISGVWGISINNELYRCQDGQLYAIEKDGNGFALSKYLDYRSRKNQAMFWRRFIGERQGDNNPFNDAHVYRASLGNDSSAKAEAIRLNMSSGNIDNL